MDFCARRTYACWPGISFRRDRTPGSVEHVLGFDAQTATASPDRGVGGAGPFVSGRLFSHKPPDPDLISSRNLSNTYGRLPKSWTGNELVAEIGHIPRPRPIIPDHGETCRGNLSPEFRES